MVELLGTERVRKNRGGCLDKVLKEQRHTNRIEENHRKELQAACEDAATSNDIKIDGMTPYEYAIALITRREQDKENEKEAKVRRSRRAAAAAAVAAAASIK